jgi:hypothetical protein
MYIETTLPKLTLSDADNTNFVYWAPKTGLVMLKSVTFEVGGQKIDKDYGHWMSIWNELTLPESKKGGWERMVGGPSSTTKDATRRAWSTTGFDGATISEDHATAGVVPETKLKIPLEFWFCRNPGLAIPLIALQYHDVKVHVEFATASELLMVKTDGATGSGTVTADGSSAFTLSTTTGETAISGWSLKTAPVLYVDYVYLDTEERRKFAKQSHEYLIEQLQFTGDESVASTSANIRLNFNHPVKELVWTCQPSINTDVTAGSDNKVLCQFDNQYYTGRTAANLITTKISASESTPLNPVVDAKLQLNGHDRFSSRDGEYFNLVQPFQHHTRVPTDRGINVYSFALKPEDHQPSGTCNFSRIDNATLNLTLRAILDSGTYTVRTYARNYNIFRVVAGMGGVSFSN